MDFYKALLEWEIELGNAGNCWPDTCHNAMLPPAIHPFNFDLIT